MFAEPKRIKVTPDSELARLLEEASKTPLILDKDGELFRLKKEDVWAGYDPERVREALRTSAGTLTGADADKLIADIYRAREEGSRPVNRP